MGDLIDDQRSIINYKNQISLKKWQTLNNEEITEKDRKKAQKCVECYACCYARKKQRGIIFWFVRTIENSICPYCKAYERVYGRKAHEPVPVQ